MRESQGRQVRGGLKTSSRSDRNDSQSTTSFMLYALQSVAIPSTLGVGALLPARGVFPCEIPRVYIKKGIMYLVLASIESQHTQKGQDLRGVL